MMIPMWAVLTIWFALAMVWHGVYRHFMNVLGYENAGSATKVVVELFKQFVPICSFIMLDLGTYILSLLGVSPQ